jgi:hypothetical protein
VTDTLYSSKAPLAVAPAHLRREIGVSALAIPHHAGLNGPAASIERETPTLNTASLGSIVTMDAAERAITEATRKTISDLDAAISELYGHRTRLAREYRRRAPDDPTAGEPSPLLQALIASEAKAARLEAEQSRLYGECAQAAELLEGWIAVDPVVRSSETLRVVASLLRMAAEPGSTEPER